MSCSLTLLEKDEETFKLLSNHAHRLLAHSIEYSQKRKVQEKIIADFPAIQEKIITAQAMLNIFENAVQLKTAKKYLMIFIEMVLLDVLDQLLFIQGASGYMYQSESAQVWLICHEHINHLRGSS